MAKISKADIQKTIESVPIETILTGIPQGIKLTAKQKKFAKGVADGLTKTESYKRAYKANGKRETIATEACNLSKTPNVATIIEAYKRANEMREYQLPEKTRSLLFSELIKHSLDEKFPPAQRVKCLELLGKLSDVGAFTERRESVVIHESSKIKERLLDQLKTIVSAEVKEVKDTDAEDLLAQLTGAPLEKAENDHPTHSLPPEDGNDHHGSHIHSIPLTQPLENTNSSETCKNTESQDVDFKEEKDEVVTLPVEDGKKEGVGVDINVADAGWSEYKEDPPSNLGTMDRGDI